MERTESDLAQVCRKRAQDHRVRAEHMSSPHTRANLLQIADEYETMAHREDERVEAKQRAAAS